MQAATRTPHVPHLYGPSAQAALLCALLAASGDPYNDPRDAAAASHASPPEPLLGVAAISAALGERPAGKSLTDVPLLPVGSTNTKLDQAKIQKLDTVIFSENQGLSDEAQQWKADRAAAEAAHRQYAGLHIERAGTVGEALNTLLVCNQYQKAYQEQIARQWRDQWLPPTGEWDPKPQSAAPATT